jgi:hypothetical protein
MPKIILDVDDKEAAIYRKQYLNAGDLRETIEELETKKPKDKRSKEYKEWVRCIDFLYSLYNVKVGYKAYKIIGNARRRVSKKTNTG